MQKEQIIMEKKICVIREIWEKNIQNKLYRRLNPNALKILAIKLFAP